MAGLCSIVGAMLMALTGVDPYVALVLALLLGAFLGLQRLPHRVPSREPVHRHARPGRDFAGMVLVITQGYPVTGIPENFAVLGRGMIGFLPVPAVIMVVGAVILTFVLNRLPHKEHLRSGR